MKLRSILASTILISLLNIPSTYGIKPKTLLKTLAQRAGITKKLVEKDAASITNLAETPIRALKVVDFGPTKKEYNSWVEETIYNARYGLFVEEDIDSAVSEACLISSGNFWQTDPNIPQENWHTQIFLSEDIPVAFAIYAVYASGIERHAYLSRFAVDKTFRKQGFGSQSIIWILHHLAVRESVDYVSVHCHAKNKAAQRLYAKYFQKRTKDPDGGFTFSSRF